MTIPDDFEHDDELIEQAILRLNALAIALGLGLLCGLGLFAATLLLAWRGGPWPGEHLGLLAQYFPGYTVTVGGSFLGLAYGFVVGGIGGYLLAAIYNRVAR